MRELVHIGLIGLGPWGANALRTLHPMPDVEITWTAGQNWKSKLERFPPAPGLRGVVIAVPAPAQPEIAIALLDASVPVFLEKPLALSAYAARRIQDKALTMGDLPVLVDHIGLFTPEYEALRSELTGRKIERLETFAGNFGPFRDWGEHATLWDYGSHEAAFAIDLLGVPDSVSSVYTNSTSNGTNYVANLEWNHDAWATLSFGNAYPQKTRTLIVHADDIRWKLDGTIGNGARITRDGVPVDVGPPVPPLEKALSVWIAAVRGEPRDIRVGCSMGVDVTELLERMILRMPQ